MQKSMIASPIQLQYLTSMTQPSQSENPVQITESPRRKSLWKKALRNWRRRHQHSFNFAIHLVGIPLTLIGLISLLFAPWYWGVGLFVLGYLLQYVGHLVEGNDVGEWLAIKKLFGLPGVAISPRWEDPGAPL
jgi:hypothetical protein